MALLGQAALAMWWDIAPELRAEFEHWHSHEHFPERLAIPGFLRASRWSSADEGEGFFVLYELAGYDVLSSPGYLARLNAPSAWSTKMMPHHRNMVRTQCKVLESCGPALARHALTVRLAPVAGREEELQGAVRSLGQQLLQRPGLAGLHLLRHTPPQIAATEEQKIRGLGDAGADWILVATGYELAALRELGATELAPAALERAGAAPGALSAWHALSASATRGDML